MFEILFAFLFTLAAGIGVALILAPKEQVSLPELIGLSALFAEPVAGLMMLVSDGIPAPGIRRATVAGASVLICIAGLAIYFKAKKSVALRRPRPGSRLLFLVLLIQCALVLWQTIVQPLQYDGVFDWEIKAHFASLNGGHIPADCFTSPSLVWSHPRYPLMLPLNQVWIYSWLGHCDQTAGKLITPLFYIAAIGFFMAAGQKLGGSLRRGTFGAILMFFVPILLIGPGSVTAAWADFPLAAAYLAATLYLLFHATGGSSGDLHRCGWCAALLPWIKHEGSILWAVVIGIALVSAVKRGQIRTWVFALLPGAIVIVAWNLFVHAVHALSSSDFVRPGITPLMENLDNLGVAAVFLVREFFRLSRWSLLWPAAFIALWIYSRRPGREWTAAMIAAAMFLPMGIYTGVYVFSAWPSVYFHITTSLPRLIGDVALVALLPILFTFPALNPATPGRSALSEGPGEQK